MSNLRQIGAHRESPTSNASGSPKVTPKMSRPQSDALAALGVTERQATNEQRTERAQRSDAETGATT